MSSPECDGIPPAFTPLARRSPFLDAIGPVYSRPGPGGLSIGLRLAPKHANARGFAHGGVLLTLCDIGLGYAAAYTEDSPLSATTIHIATDFAGSARIGDWVESRPDIQHIGSRLAFINVYLLVNSKGIVRANGVFLCDGAPRGQ